MQSRRNPPFELLRNVIDVRFPCVQPFLRNDLTPSITGQAIQTKGHSIVCEITNVRDDDRVPGDLGLGHCGVMLSENSSNKGGVKTLQREL